MKKGEDVFKAGVKWIIGRNSEVNFWMDNWAPQGPLWNLVQGPLNRDEEKLKVKEVLMTNAWNWNKISFELPLSTKLEVQATPYAIAARSEDRLAWKTNSHGKFDLYSAYKLATSNDEDQDFQRSVDMERELIQESSFFFGSVFTTVSELMFARMQGGY